MVTVARGGNPPSPFALAGSFGGQLFGQQFGQGQQQGRLAGALGSLNLQGQTAQEKILNLARNDPGVFASILGSPGGASLLNAIMQGEEPTDLEQRFMFLQGLSKEEREEAEQLGIIDSELTPEEREEIARREARGRATGTAEVAPRAFSRIISGDSELNRRFRLGIPAGQQARVEFTRDSETDSITNASVQSAFGTPQTNVTVRTGQEFQEQLGKGAAPQINEIIERGQRAVGTEQNLVQLGDLLVTGTQTGTLQRLITPLQGLAEDIGINTSAIGDLSKKENFDRLSRQIIIDGFEKFRGNLNEKEVEIAENAFGNLGRSEESNIDAVAAGLASEQIARERAQQATQIRTFEQARALQAEILGNDASRFQQIKKQFKTQIETRQQEFTTTTSPAIPPPRQEAEPLPAGIPEGSRRIGSTQDGLPVFETPDGRQLVVE